MTKVHFEVQNGIGSLVLDNPGKANCIDLEMADEIAILCDQIDADLTVGGVILSGANGSFCSGADRDILANVAQDPADVERFAVLGQIYDSFHRIGRLKVPTIAAVRGAAVGAGVNLMLSTDMRLMADDARIRPGFQRLGLHPGGGHFALLGRTVAWDTCAALGLFGAELTGSEAAALGMAWQSYPDLEVEAAAEKFATAAANDPLLSREVVASMRAELGPPALAGAAASELERARQMWSLRRSSVVIDR